MSRRISTRRKLPDASEWDFRSINDASLPIVTLYEYAREAKLLRKRVADWLGAPVQGRSLREQLLQACKDNKMSPAPIIDDLPAKIGLGAINSGIVARIPYALIEVILDHRPDFPRAWLKHPITFEANPRYSRILCTPISWTMRHLKEMPELAGVYERSNDKYMLDIDWDGATAGEISAHLERWVREEVKRRKLSKRGAAAQLPYWKLKALAALRLRRAGFTFEAAQESLDKLNSDASRKRPILPIFADPESWTDACQRAEAEIISVDASGF